MASYNFSPLLSFNSTYVMQGLQHHEKMHTLLCQWILVPLTGFTIIILERSFMKPSHIQNIQCWYNTWDHEICLLNFLVIVQIIVVNWKKHHKWKYRLCIQPQMANYARFVEVWTCVATNQYVELSLSQE